MDTYKFYYDESEHSRKINYKTVTAPNYYDNFVTVVVGWTKEKEKEVGIKSIQMDLKIMYEDKNLLIIDKDPYLVVHPTTKKTDLTLANGVIYYLQEQTGKIQPPRFFNRLDMNTSGLIVVAKNAYTQAFLQSDKEKVSKFYQAIVKGIVKKDEMMI